MKSFILSVCLPFAFIAIPGWGVEIVAHRGASHAAPENTIAAFDLAWELGADIAEGDFQLTADGEIVCVHDKSTKRVAGKNLTVSKSTLAQLQALDVGSWKGPKWTGTRIPTLEAVLEAMPNDRGRIFIELKDTTRIVGPLIQKIRASGMDSKRINIICFDKKVVAACRAAMPEIQTHWLVNAKTYKTLGTDGLLAELERIGASGVDIQASREIRPELAKRLHAKKLALHCWTVNDATMTRHMTACGVDSITTDRPASMRSWAVAHNKDNVVLNLSFDDTAPPGERVAGIRGKALSNNILKTKASLPQEGTVSLWYRPVAWYNYQSIFDNTTHENVWEMWIDAEAQIGFRTTPKDVRLTYRLHKVASKGQWQHLAASWNQKTATLYLNGIAVQTSVRKHPESPGKGLFCLGGGNAGNVKAKGAWDDVVIFNRSLLAQDIRALMLDGPPVQGD